MKNKYTYEISWSDEDSVFISRCLEFPSLAAHGKSEVVALKEILELVEDILVDMKKSKEPIPEPIATRNYSGVTNLRMPKSLHRELAKEAARQDVSLNQLLLHKIGRG